MPMVMITGQKAIKSTRQARFQLVDIVGAPRRQSGFRHLCEVVWRPRASHLGHVGLGADAG